MPTTCSPYAGEMPARDKIADIYTDGYLQATERQLRFATAGLGLRLSPGATILDFGCGIGSSVRALLAQGYDAYGVDVLEYWDRDFDKYWLIGDKPPAEVTDRLKLADPANYRLPFEDGTFDFCFSDQVFEHIFDYKTTMSEIVRVLKPSGLSLHNFPGPNNFMEGHVNLPLSLALLQPFLSHALCLDFGNPRHRTGLAWARQEQYRDHAFQQLSDEGEAPQDRSLGRC